MYRRSAESERSNRIGVWGWVVENSRVVSDAV